MHTHAQRGPSALAHPCNTATRSAPRRRPLVGSIQQDYPPAKLTHKLQPMLCVLWLRERRGYLLDVDLVSGRFTTVPSPDEARRLPEDDAEELGQALIDVTGVRIELRPYYPRASQLSLVGV